MDYRPNVDAVRWFVREVWPGLKRQVPDLGFTIVGRDPTRDVLRLGEVPGVRVTGAVPDVRPYLREATAAVVPLLIARGIQNKILEAMAMGRAVVGSPGAVEGLEVERGVDLLEAETPDEWHRCVMDLLADAGLRARLEQSARACVVAKYAWDARMRPLVAVCERLLGERPAGDPAAAPRPEEGPAA
jgi:glycosyltransferase involved in cell wall biosynthesis